MRSIKEYKAPEAAVIEFECADVITESVTNTLDKTNNQSGHTYVNAGSRKWGDIYDN